MVPRMGALLVQVLGYKCGVVVYGGSVMARWRGVGSDGSQHQPAAPSTVAAQLLANMPLMSSFGVRVAVPLPVAAAVALAWPSFTATPDSMPMTGRPDEGDVQAVVSVWSLGCTSSSTQARVKIWGNVKGVKIASPPPAIIGHRQTRLTRHAGVRPQLRFRQRKPRIGPRLRSCEHHGGLRG